MLQAKSLYHMRGRIDEIPRGRWLALLKAIHRLVGTVSRNGTFRLVLAKTGKQLTAIPIAYVKSIFVG